MSYKSSLSNCPRCNSRSYEILTSYAHCIQCNYFSDEYEEAIAIIPKWAIEAVRSHQTPVTGK